MHVRVYVCVCACVCACADCCVRLTVCGQGGATNTAPYSLPGGIVRCWRRHWAPACCRPARCARGWAPLTASMKSELACGCCAACVCVICCVSVSGHVETAAESVTFGRSRHPRSLHMHITVHNVMQHLPRDDAPQAGAVSARRGGSGRRPGDRPAHHDGGNGRRLVSHLPALLMLSTAAFEHAHVTCVFVCHRSM